MTSSPTTRAGVALAGLAAVALLVAGCSHTDDGTPKPAIPTAISSTPATPTPSAEATSPSLSATPTPTVTTSHPSAASTAPSSLPPKSTSEAAASCLASQLSIDVTKGGASLGQEIAVVTFTNVSSSPCTLSGYPQAVLETSGGGTLGQPALHVAGHVATVLLTPTKSAQADLTADTRCNAPESSAVRVSPPGVPGSTDVPVALRACALHITALT